MDFRDGSLLHRIPRRAGQGNVGGAAALSEVSGTTLTGRGPAEDSGCLLSLDSGASSPVQSWNSKSSGGQREASGRALRVSTGGVFQAT